LEEIEKRTKWSEKQNRKREKLRREGKGLDEIERDKNGERNMMVSDSDLTGCFLS